MCFAVKIIQKMGPKKDLDRQAWNWAETTDPETVNKEHVEAAYRLGLKPCKPGACRRNCKGNPRCVNGLGEKHWMRQLEDSYWHDIEDPEGERREKGAFVGLKNLGATCYVNTFLQVWYHNQDFRCAIYQWRDPEDEAVWEESIHAVEKRLSEEMETVLAPKSAVGQLQLIFALLENSNRRYVDPSSFIQCLGLDTGQQQDAQEFSKLFISMLESSLAQQADPLVNNLIQDLFSGQYYYVTRCNFCGFSSQRESSFFEMDLNIKGNKDLCGCIKEFLQEESLEGDNQYYCAQCSAKRDAKRFIKLASLPRVLNLQLLRFVFQRETGHKKKLNTYIEFPEVLDMSPFVERGSNELYNLTAVLIHRGPSAYSGHYVAHILDEKTQTWYKFNDEETEKMGGKNLQLGNEEEVTGGSKKPKTSKGFHASRNAYMLVYRQSSDTTKVEPASEPVKPPNYIECLVNNDNLKFEDWIKEMKNMQVENVTKGRARQAEINDLWFRLPVKPGGEFEWIAMEWLAKWLNPDRDTIPEIWNKPCLCVHSKVDPDQVHKLKCVSTDAAEVLFAKYGGQPRLKEEHLCLDCVRERCRVIRTKARLLQDHKYITEALKNTSSRGDFWVGKSSLRSWRRLVMEQLEGSTYNTSNGSCVKPATKKKPSDMAECDSDNRGGINDGTEESNGVTKDFECELENIPCEKDISESKEGCNQRQGEGDAVVHSSKGRHDATELGDNDSDSGEVQITQKETLSFNEDLLCEEHNNLSTDPSCRRLVSKDVWTKLRAYFPGAPEFAQDAPVCCKCQHLDAAEQEKQSLNRVLAAEQKAALHDLYSGKHPAAWGHKVTQLNVVPQEFLLLWRQFIRDPVNNDPVVTVTTSSLLCPHGGLPFQPETMGIDDQDQCELIWPHQWKKLKEFMSAEEEISLVRVQEDDGHVTFLSTPEACTECTESRLEELFQSKLNYTQGVIYVRKMTPDKSIAHQNSKDGSSISSQESSCASVGEDPDFIEMNGKRKKGGDHDKEKQPKLDPSLMATRKSTRHRKIRGEKEVTVSSSQTLRDLKIQIMKLFSVAPFDQHLTLDGKEIDADNTCSLASLRIIPGSIIYLKADEPGDDPMFMEEVPAASCPEEGFKGTGLLGSS